MGRGKIERQTKREKMDFHLGGTQEEGESKVLPSSRRKPRRREQRVVTFDKIAKEERVKCYCL